MSDLWPLPPIGTLQPAGHFFLAPMEAVNCASFRLLCRTRGAAIVYTDMIDADLFYDYAQEHSDEKAISHYLNAQNDEQPLAIQLGGAQLRTLAYCIRVMRPYAALFDFNVGCPLGYMLGKKGGCYLMKHPARLQKLLCSLREIIDIPFTIKIRSGWDEHSINAVEIAKMAQAAGIDAVAIHPRTRKQGYRDRADWRLVREIKQSVDIPVILSGDVCNTSAAWKARNLTGCDYIMIARAAKANPSVFRTLARWETAPSEPPAPPKTTYEKSKADPYRDFCDFLALYKTRERRYRLSELRDHALWTASECRQASHVRQQIIDATTEENLLVALKDARF